MVLYSGTPANMGCQWVVEFFSLMSWRELTDFWKMNEAFRLSSNEDAAVYVVIRITHMLRL